MPSVVDVVSTASAAGVPILFLDTCVLLDIIRAPFRNLPQCVEGAVRLEGLSAATPPACTIVVASFVPGEWAKHDGDTTEELRRHLHNLDEHARQFHEACAHLSLTVPFAQAAYGSLPLAGELSSLSHRLLGRALVID